MARAKLSVRTVTTESRPVPARGPSGEDGRLIRQRVRVYCCQLILDKIARFKEVRHLRPLIRPHCPRRNQCSPNSVPVEQIFTHSVPAISSQKCAENEIMSLSPLSSASWAEAWRQNDRTCKMPRAYRTCGRVSQLSASRRPPSRGRSRAAFQTAWSCDR